MLRAATGILQEPPLAEPYPPSAEAIPAQFAPSEPALRRFAPLLSRWGTRPIVLADLIAGIVGAQVFLGFQLATLALVVVTIWLYAASGLYRPRLSMSVLDDLPILAMRAVVAAALVIAAVIAFGTHRHGDHVLMAVGTMTAAIVAARVVCYAVVRWARRTGVISHRTLVIGAGQVGATLGKQLLAHREYGLRPVGFVDSDPLLAGTELPLPVFGGPDRLAQILELMRVQVVVVSFSATREAAMVDVIRTCDRMRCEIFFVPRLYELQSFSRDVQDVWGIPLVRLRRSAYRTLSWKLKRAFDVAVSGTALLVLSPLMLACMVAVRLEGGPGVLFRQERVGLDGRPFELLKFRSLRPADEEESQTRWSVATDDRLGPVGRLLRRTSLDELPQLWNVLRGDMTLVGPRPERPHFVAQFSGSTPRYMARHRVPAGLTGWAQVHGLRGDTSIEERARFDNRYIESWSMWSDVKILLRTVASVVRCPGS
jgi:exopolysaccharide biosynthesis polyprenyl glycosylphosphotransferase